MPGWDVFIKAWTNLENFRGDAKLNTWLYRIAINENVFGQNFQLQQNNIPIEIIHQNEIVTINFIARERTRQIRIQQPGNNQQQSPPQPD